MKKELFKLFLLSLLVAFVACEGEPSKDDVDPKKDDTHVDQNPQLENDDNRVSMVPTPNELFDIIKEIVLNRQNTVSHAFCLRHYGINVIHNYLIFIA